MSKSLQSSGLKSACLVLRIRIQLPVNIYTCDKTHKDVIIKPVFQQKLLDAWAKQSIDCFSTGSWVNSLTGRNETIQWHVLFFFFQIHLFIHICQLNWLTKLILDGRVPKNVWNKLFNKGLNKQFNSWNTNENQNLNNRFPLINILEYMRYTASKAMRLKCIRLIMMLSSGKRNGYY